jgi:hypothetical protein
VGLRRQEGLAQRPVVSWLKQPPSLPIADEILMDGEPRCDDRDAE